MSGSGLIPRTPPAYLESYERDQARETGEWPMCDECHEERATDVDGLCDSCGEQGQFLAEHLS